MQNFSSYPLTVLFFLNQLVDWKFWWLAPLVRLLLPFFILSWPLQSRVRLLLALLLPCSSYFHSDHRLTSQLNRRVLPINLVTPCILPMFWAKAFCPSFIDVCAHLRTPPGLNRLAASSLLQPLPQTALNQLPLFLQPMSSSLLGI
jgi:hypothetical protein